jgi:hypothetical protein
MFVSFLTILSVHKIYIIIAEIFIKLLFPSHVFYSSQTKKKEKTRTERNSLIFSSRFMSYISYFSYIKRLIAPETYRD